MRISCLIAAYQAGDYIPRALESLRAQLYTNWELIVVEDGSRDATETIVQTFGASVPQDVRYENLGRNRGVAVARNRLLELAGGDAVAFLDADDWWSPVHLQRVVEGIRAGAGLVVSRVQTVELPGERLLNQYQAPEGFFRDPLLGLFDRSAIITSSSVAIAADVVAKAGWFDSTLRIGEDRDYWMRCAAVGATFKDSKEISCFYAKHASSTMAKTLLWAQQEVAFYRKHWALVAVPGHLRRQRLVQALLNFGRLSRATDPKQSIEALATAWSLEPLSRAAAMQLGYSLLLGVRRLLRSPSEA